LTNVLTR